MTPINLQALINAAPDFSEIDLPFDAYQEITTSIQIYNRQGLKIKCAGGVGSSSTGSPAGQSGAILVWNGPTPMPVIDCQSSRGITIEGLTINCLTLADSGINFDTLSTGGKQICSDNKVLHCAILGFTSSSSQFACVRISRNSKTNCDFIKVKDCYLNAQQPYPPTPAGYGVWIGPSSNAKSELVEDTMISGALCGVYMENGDAMLNGLSGTGNGTDFYLSDVEIVDINHANFEQSGCAMYINGGQISVKNSRWGALKGPYVFNLGGPGTRAVILENNTTNVATGTLLFNAPTTPWNFPILCRCNTWICPTVPTTNLPNLQSLFDAFNYDEA